MTPTKKCKADRCDRDASPFPSRKGYCEKCRRQVERKGYPYKSKREPNLFIEDGNICRIELYTQKGETSGYAIIDIEDKAKVEKYKWSIVHKNKISYVKSSTLLYLHHLILGNPPEGMMVDHRDRNGLYNVKSNLRFCTSQQNNMNKIKSSSNTSGYKGVIWDKRSSKWIARIRNNFKTIQIGVYNDAISAAKAYDKKAKLLFGEFARPNFS